MFDKNKTKWNIEICNKKKKVVSFDDDNEEDTIDKYIFI